MIIEIKSCLRGQLYEKIIVYLQILRNRSPVTLQMFQCTESDDLVLFFVPQPQDEKTKTMQQRYRLHRLKQRYFLLHFIQTVVRYARAEMMNVMEADVAAEELKDFRKFVVRTPLQCGFEEIPLFVMLPVRIIELVLHVKEPQSEHPREPDHREHNANEGNKSDQHAHPGSDRDKRNGRPMHASFFPRTGMVRRKPVSNIEHHQRSGKDHRHRIPVDAVHKAFPP